MDPMRDGRTAQLIGEYLGSLNRGLQQLDLNAIGRVVQHLCAARDRYSTIYLAGNGGSAASASHWANDLGKATKRSGRPPMRVMNLSDNVPWLTALANDEGYERVFAGQLENFARAGDVLVVISASGNSLNLVRAVELARARGVVTVGLLGFDGGVLKTLVDDYVWVRTDKGAYGLVESLHAIVFDIVTTCLMRDREPADDALA
jgi:D-sedoheptulose 7-phosphate isomerase